VPNLAAMRREQILTAATRVFARVGYRCADLQDVADDLGVGKGTLYRYFPTKEALFTAAVDRVMVGMRGTIDEAISGTADELAVIRAAVRAYLGYFDRHPEFVELLIQERAEFRDRKKSSYFTHREANIERWREFYSGLIAAGTMRNIPVDRITEVMSNAIYGAMFTNYFGGRRKALVDQADDILDVLFHGLLAAPEKKRPGKGGRS
jgi:AcrR family transcriptional regulator